MLFRTDTLEGIRAGIITLAFRRWRRPTVRTGGTLLTAVGQFHIASVAPIAIDQISAEDARRAGFSSTASLLEELRRRTDGEVYRIELGPLRADPRIALREASAVTESEAQEVLARLRRLDASATGGAWTRRTLDVLASHPGVRAGDLCGLVGLEKDPFKINVRKLKNLGLTESLSTGYRLSPRGEAVLRLLRAEGGDKAR